MKNVIALRSLSTITSGLIPIELGWCKWWTRGEILSWHSNYGRTLPGKVELSYDGRLLLFFSGRRYYTHIKERRDRHAPHLYVFSSNFLTKISLYIFINSYFFSSVFLLLQHTTQVNILRGKFYKYRCQNYISSRPKLLLYMQIWKVKFTVKINLRSRGFKVI